MKVIATHCSPDWDAITSVWLLKRYLPGWNEADVQFVPAGQRLPGSKNLEEVVEQINKVDVIHVDTGMGPLDHHQTSDQEVCGASRCWDYIQAQNSKLKTQSSDKTKDHHEAISRIVKVVVAIDHFREVFWDNPTADYHEFSLLGVLEGLKIFKPDQDSYYVEFGMECLDALLHAFENRIWAEKEIAEKGIAFECRWGKGMAFETINDTVLKLAQKMGYNIVVRKDPRKGYVRIKAKPSFEAQNSKLKVQNREKDIDLTLVYEKLSKMDPAATWYLHVSKKMLLNGTPKNPKMVPTKLTLKEIVKVLEQI